SGSARSPSLCSPLAPIRWRVGRTPTQGSISRFSRSSSARSAVALSHKGTAHEVEDHKGVALWLPLGIEPDQAALAASLPVEREAELAAVFDGWLLSSGRGSFVPAAHRRRSRASR